MRFVVHIALAFIFLLSCQQHYVLQEDYAVKSFDYSSGAEDSSLAALVKPYKAKMETEMNQVVGFLGEDMERGYPEGKLGNFAADIFYERAAAEVKLDPSTAFCIYNNGGLRVALSKGEITRGRIFELLPFENTLCLVDLRGNDVLTGIAAWIKEKKGQPVSANAYVEFSGNALKRFEVNGKPIDTSVVYTIVTNDYLANGGDNLEFLKKGTNKREFSNIKLRDCFMEYVKTHSSPENPLMSTKPGRIKFN